MDLKLRPLARVERWLFESPPGPAGQPLAGLVRGLRFPFALLRDLWRGELNLRAMGLVYTTLLSIVPLLALAFAVLKAFGLHRELQPLLQEALSPAGPGAEATSSQVIAFVDNVHSGVLGGIGLALLVYTAITAVQKVEASFNFAWHVTESRSLLRRIGEYLALLTFGPVFIAVVMALFAAAADTGLAQWLAGHPPFDLLLSGVGAIAPYLLVIAVFSALYYWVPNTRVRPLAALAGGTAGGLLWSAAGMLFAELLFASARMVAIYAGFALFLVTLVWIYVSWVTLLVGAQLSFYVQNPRYLRVGRAPLSLTTQMRERLALSVMVLVGRAFRDGQPGWSDRALADRLEVPGAALTEVMEPLERRGLLMAGRQGQWLPGRALDRIAIREVVSAIREEAGSETAVVGEARTDPVADRLAAAMEAALEGQLEGLSLRSLVESPVKA